MEIEDTNIMPYAVLKALGTQSRGCECACNPSRPRCCFLPALGG